MQRSGHTGDMTGTGRADMIRIHLQAYHLMMLWIHGEPGAETAEGFSQRYGRPSMQQAGWLPGAMIHRHRTLEEIGSQFR